jgi:NAD(P)-dependent dehydrogenase (short-subunit alcohol dehydrogenase family)
MKTDLKGRVCAVTGASVGIGRALAVALGASGASLALVARSRDRLNQTRSLVEANGGRARTYPIDLRDLSAIVAGAEAILNDWGRVDLIANVAGVWHDGHRVYQGLPLHRTPFVEVDEVLDVGIRAPMMLTAALLPSMARRHAGHVLNISGSFRDGASGWLHYYVSKKAIEAFTIGLAQEVRDVEVQVNCISPADVATEPFRRLYPESVDGALQPEEVAEVALTLIGDAGRHITGQIIEVRNRTDHA